MRKSIGWWMLLLGGALLVAGTAVVRASGGKAPEEERVVVFGGQVWLGVKISDVSTERAAELKLPSATGVVVEEVEEDSPAAKGGLQANDVILGFADERVRSAAQLRRLVGETPVGRKVSLQVSRNGQTRSVEVTLEERRARILGRTIRVPEVVVPHIEIPEIQIFGRGPRLGISGDELTPQLAEYFGVKQGKGVLVREVLAGSAAEKAGLKAGDVIVRVDGEEIGDVGELRRALVSERKEVALTIVRDRKEQSVKVELEEARHFAPRRTAELYVPDPDLDYDYDYDFDLEVLPQLEDRLRESEKWIEKQLESQEFQNRLRAVERRAVESVEEIEKRLESEEFQKKLREIERKARELERSFAFI
ncbi:MAG: PDZ domain-containing protein [Acidobacteria bacterium]|nr:PDZ domain-containing protein [Acidobacteriota bacterium]